MYVLLYVQKDQACYREELLKMKAEFSKEDGDGSQTICRTEFYDLERRTPAAVPRPRCLQIPPRRALPPSPHPDLQRPALVPLRAAAGVVGQL